MATLGEFARIMVTRIEFKQVPDLTDAEINKMIIELLKEIEKTLLDWRGLNQSGDDFFNMDIVYMRPVKMSSISTFREDIFVVKSALENYPLFATKAQDKVQCLEYRDAILLNLRLILRLLS